MALMCVCVCLPACLLQRNRESWPERVLWKTATWEAPSTNSPRRTTWWHEQGRLPWHAHNARGLLPVSIHSYLRWPDGVISPTWLAFKNGGAGVRVAQESGMESRQSASEWWTAAWERLLPSHLSWASSHRWSGPAGSTVLEKMDLCVDPHRTKRWSE